jgi:hypothetical protein
LSIPGTNTFTAKLTLMKKLFLLNALCIFTILALQAQDTIKDKHISIVYDFNKRDVPDSIKEFGRGRPMHLVQNVWFGKRAYIQIIVNPYLYDVHISSKQVTDDGLNDSDAAKIFTDAITTLQKGITKTDTSSKKTFFEPKVQAIQNDVPFNQVLNSAKFIVQQTPQDFDVTTQNTIIKLKKNIDNFPTSTPLIAYSIADLKNNISNYSKPIQNFINIGWAHFSEIKAIVQNQADIERAQYINERNNFLDAIHNFDTCVDNLKTFLDASDHSFMLMLSDWYSPLQMRNKIEEDLRYYNYDSINGFIQQSSFLIYRYQDELTQSYRALGQSLNSLQELKNSFMAYKEHRFSDDSTLFSQYDSAYKLISSSHPEVIIKTISGMLRNLQNPNAFVHPYHTDFLKADTLAYTIQLRPSARYDSLIKLYNIKLYHIDSFTYIVPVKGNFKLNFSVGLSFVHGNLKSTSYYFQPDENDNTKETIIQAKKTNSFRPVVSAFAHAYLKLGGYINPALTFGISSDLTNATYMLGGSCIFGHQSRFIMTVGIAGGSVDFLKGKYDLNKTYLVSDLKGISESDLAEKTFKTGLFLGFSYNISSNR